MVENLMGHSLPMFAPETPRRVARDSVTPLLVIAPSTQHQPVRLDRRPVGAARTLDGITVQDVVFGADTGRVDGLPDPSADTWYVVPLLAALAATDRDDLLVVHDPVDDLEGSAIGWRTLARPVRPGRGRQPGSTPRRPVRVAPGPPKVLYARAD